MAQVVDLLFILHPFMASATKSRAQRLLRVDEAQRWHGFQTLYANPAEEDGATWMVVASAGTISQLPITRPGPIGEGPLTTPTCRTAPTTWLPPCLEVSVCRRPRLAEPLFLRFAG